MSTGNTSASNRRSSSSGFERLNLLADGGLTDTQHLGRAAEALGGGYGLKGPELIQRHRHLFPEVIGFMKKYHWQLYAPAPDNQPSIHFKGG